MWKRKLRWFVVWMSRSPLLAQAFRVLYGLVIWLSIQILRRHRTILAIYLSRGCAKKSISPGISDIDLLVVTTSDGNERASVQNDIRWMGRATGGLIDYYPNMVMSRESLLHRWRTSPAWQYRLDEGKRTWTLLDGADVIAGLPPLTEAQLRTACYVEMNRWWVLFAEKFLKTSAHHSDMILRNSTCSKAVSEVLNVEWALRTGEHRRSRAEGLAACDHKLSRKLAAVSASSMLSHDDDLLDETLDFLLARFSNLWESFTESPYLNFQTDVSQEVDCPQSEIEIEELIAQHLSSIYSHLELHWSGKCLTIQTVKSAFWDWDDLLLIVEVDMNNLPTVKEISDLSTLHERTQPATGQRILLFLRVGSVVFPIAPTIPRDLHRVILTPATIPDVFLQLGVVPVYWTDYTRWYLCEWRSNEQWLLTSSEKKLQLERIASSAQKRHVIYPLTKQSLARQQTGANATEDMAVLYSGMCGGDRRVRIDIPLEGDPCK